MSGEKAREYRWNGSKLDRQRPNCLRRLRRPGWRATWATRRQRYARGLFTYFAVRARAIKTLSLHISSIVFGIGGTLESTLIGVALGPFELDIELDNASCKRAAWSMEKISIQHLVISLDSFLEINLSGNRLNENETKDFCTFVRCLRNAFSHNPYKPPWQLKNPNYRRNLIITDSWAVDLTDKNGTPVCESQYKYASGLVKLVEMGRSMCAND